MKTSTRILTAVVVVAAGYTAASWYVGKKAQAVLQQWVVQANERLRSTLGPGADESGARLAISEYKRHVFSSDVVYTLQMQDSRGQRVEYLLSDHLQHGPFPLDALKSGSVAPLMASSRAQLIPSAATQKWFDSLKGQSPVTATTRIGFTGKGSSAWRFMPIDLQDGGDSVKFSGGAIDAVFSNNFRDSVVKGAFGGLQYVSASKRESLDVRGITLTSTATTTDNGAQEVKTNSQAAADTFILQSGEGIPVQLDKVGLSLDSVQRNQHMDLTLQYKLGAIRIGETGFGSVEASLRGRNLDLDALSALAADYDRIQARHGGTPDEALAITPDEAAVLRDRLWTVLDSKPQLAVDPLVWKNDKGESRLTVSVDLARPADPSAAGDTATLLAQMIKQLDLNVMVAKPMFIQTFSQLQGGASQDGRAAMMGAMLFDVYTGRLARAGLVAMDGGNAAIRLRYGNDSVEINGKKMPVVEFVQRLLGAAM